MSLEVASPFTLEGRKYKPGQMVGKSFPLGSIACSLRTGLLVEASVKEPEPDKPPAKKESAEKKKSDT